MNEKSIATMKVKEMNKHKVYHYIYDNKVTNKQTMTQNLQMGLSTVTQNIKILEEDGLITRNGYFDSTGGRKADALEINRLAQVAIGGAILKDCVHWVITDLYGEPFETEVVPLPFSHDEDYATKIAESFHEFMQKKNPNKNNILGVSIATQGLLDETGRFVTYGKILNNFHMDLQALSAKIPYPCRFVHDSKAAASLELWRNKEVKEGVMILLNRNLGGAIIAEGKVQEGLHGRSGTFEHLTMNQDGPLCYCGKRGCLETYCSVDHLEQRADTDIETFMENRKINSTYSIIWDDYLNYLAIAIRNLSVVLDGTFMISGYLAPFLSDEDMEYLFGRINHLATFPVDRNLLVLGTHGEFSQALGASLCYIQGFLERLK